VTDEVTFDESWARRSFDGPKWLSERRSDAALSFAAAALPTERDESFRYGLIDELDLSHFAGSSDGKASGDDALSAALLDALGANAVVVRSVDGVSVSTTFGPAGCPVGLSLSKLSDAEESPSGYGTLLAEVGESFTDLAEALTSDATVIEVAAGAVIERPIVIVHELTGASVGAAVVPRSFLHLAHHAEATLIEFYVSPSGDRLCLPVTEMLLDDGSHLAYHAIQQLGDADWQLAYQLSRVARDAELRSFSAALGGSYARLFTRSDLVGEGAESRLAATYLAKGTQVQDLRTFQEHSVARTTSNLVFKGAVSDHARSVYSGMIHMAKGARRAIAAQTNRNLVLSEGAHADSVPNLDIEENDVRCSHASAVGPIDAEQRFYLESRGVPTDVANRLILLGFFDDLFDQVPSLGCAAYLREVFTREIESGAV
jgi:Fe-S cluster assembly protein SufD